MKVDQLICHQKESLFRVLDVINQNGKGIVFAVDDKGGFKGTITDGDIRRAILAKCSLEVPAMEILDRTSPLFKKILALCNRQDVKKKMVRKSISADLGTPVEKLMAMVDSRIRIIPLVDARNRVVDFFEYKTAFHAPVASPIFQGNELAYIVDCIESNWISSQGRYVSDFERQFSNYCGSTHGIAVSSGTAALHLALTALDIGPGDEVIIPDLTFAATANAVIYTGATPVMVDIDPQTWCMDPASVKAHITSRTRALMPVHLYGQVADLAALNDIARRHRLYVIEDCAEALGASVAFKRVGSFGHIGCFSFFANKILTTGEGGMCICADDQLARRMQTLRDHGMSPERKYWHEDVGFNYRMTNLQAAVGLAQLEQIDQLLAIRERIQRQYDRCLRRLPVITGAASPPGVETVTWLVSYLLDATIDRDAFIQQAGELGIDVRPFFFVLSDMPPYQKFARRPTPIAHDVAARGVNLPTSACLKTSVYNHIADRLADLLTAASISADLPAAVGA